MIERRDRLASGLRRPLWSVWPEPTRTPTPAGWCMWVGDKPMSKTKPVAWPLLKTGTVDLFAPFPIGVDPRGRPVTVTLMFALMIIGALPRMGKTFLLRLLALAAALDTDRRAAPVRPQGRRRLAAVGAGGAPVPGR